MADTFNKKEREKKREQRKKEKQSRKDWRKDNPGGGGLENMMAYVDANGIIRDTPPDPNDRMEIDAQNIEIGVPKREKEEFDPTLTGVINFYDDSKGYGFIKTSDDESFFVHAKNISGEPGKGRQVTFEKEKGAKGWVAVRVVIK